MSAVGLFFSLGGSIGAQVQTTLQGKLPPRGSPLPTTDRDWFDSANWNNGVPNNTGGTTYWATIKGLFSEYSEIEVRSPVVVDGLSLDAGNLSVQSNLIVLQETSFSGYPRINLSVYSPTNQPVLADLGNLILSTPGVLDRANLSVWGPNQVIQWKDALIKEIAGDAQIDILSGSAAIRDSVTGLSALRQLESVKGSLLFRDGVSLSTSSSLEVAYSGTISLTQSRLEVGQNLVNRGEFVTNNLSEAKSGTEILVHGNFENFGTIVLPSYYPWISSESQLAQKLSADGNFINHRYGWIQIGATGPLETAEFRVGGSVINEGLLNIYGSVSSKVNITGDLTNSGNFSAGNGPAEIGGSLNNSGLFVYGITHDENPNAMLRVRGNVTNAGHLAILGPTTFDKSFSNFAEFQVGMQAGFDDLRVHLQIDGDFLRNSGSIKLVPGAQLTINGVFAPNSEGHLTEGEISLKGSSSHIPIFEWNGANIEVVDQGATISLEGEGGVIRNLSNGSNALANFRQNNGTLALDGATLSIQREFSNVGVIHSSNGGRFTSEALTQNSNQHLTGGKYLIEGTPANPSTIEWKGADIRVIDREASISIKGAAAMIRDTITGSDALANLRQNDGKLALSEHTMTVQDGFVNSGDLSIENGAINILGDASFSDTSMLTIRLQGGTNRDGYFLHIGSFAADGIFTLGGDLNVTVDSREGYDWIKPTETITIITAEGLVGGFDNINPGERMRTTDGIYSFLMTFDDQNQSVVLSEFLPVPEPATSSLLCLAAAGCLFLLRFRRG